MSKSHGGSEGSHGSAEKALMSECFSLTLNVFNHEHSVNFDGGTEARI